jgi:hypothetical protein
MAFAPLCEPLVNIRWTLRAAAQAGIIPCTCADRLLQIGRETFYPERSFERLLERGAEAGLPQRDLVALRDWLPHGRIDQKRADAVALLRALDAFLAGDPPPFTPKFRFESSEIWEEAAQAAHAVGTGKDAIPLEAVLDELRLLPGEFARVRREALALALALRESRAQGHPPDAAAIAAAERILRERQGIGDRRQFDRWLAENDLDEQGLDELLECQWRQDRIADMAADIARRRLVDVLRLTGRYAALARRARRKRALLAAAGADPADPTSLGQSALSLALWFFSQRLAQPVPADLEAFAATQGFADANAFLTAIAGEYLLCREEAGPKGASAAGLC